MKYQVALDDGTIVAETPEEGVEFYVKDGNLFSSNEGMDSNCSLCLHIHGDYLSCFLQVIFVQHCQEQ